MNQNKTATLISEFMTQVKAELWDAQNSADSKNTLGYVDFDDIVDEFTAKVEGLLTDNFSRGFEKGREAGLISAHCRDCRDEADPFTHDLVHCRKCGVQS